MKCETRLNHRKRGCIWIHQSGIIISTGAAVRLGQIGSFDLVEIHQSQSGNVSTTVFVIFQIEGMEILNFNQLI